MQLPHKFWLMPGTNSVSFAPRCRRANVSARKLRFVPRVSSEREGAHTKADRSIRLDAHQRGDSVAQPAMSQIVPAALVPIEREFRLGQRQWHFIDFDRQ